ncbi:N-methyl-L-tryptophan oxidase [Pseudomonas sp. LB-090624]|uniref:N-methyl-L-tryptophan oxidase n=1 Tax=Pseudomonas sp. LB-090624 TaxID=2213079 RepID=UPI000D92F543|nr:N-methyl-L-tryptophan oxidase [Pseudomonas sp. LB-090624]PYB69650.1 N-methyl-L-tryptophan oxidase [Pseudomonas sp. LB-090624]
MHKSYTAVVVGLGVVGSATLWRLAQQQQDVLGLEAGAPINLQGSSYGGSRIFRQAYWEGSDYLSLLAEADLGWRELQATSHRPLLHYSGGLFIGPIRSGVVSGSAASAKAGGIAHQRLTAAEVEARFSVFRADENMEAVFEQGAFTIAADDARLQMLNQAVAHGAQMRFGSHVQEITRVESEFLLRLSDGQSVLAQKVVLATGAGLAGSLIPDLSGLLRPRSVPIYWCAFKSGAEQLFANFPAFLYELEDGRLLYGTPQIDNAEPGIKIGFHNHQQSALDLRTQLEPASDAQIEEISACVSRVFPDLIARPYASRKCVYTMTPDEAFIIGESKELPGVFYVSACSGHGFKFAPALGSCLARALAGQSLALQVPAFSRERFSH